MRKDRRKLIPTGEEYEKAKPERRAGGILRFFKRAKKFDVASGVGEAKTVMPAPRITLPDAAPEVTPTRLQSPSVPTQKKPSPPETLARPANATSPSRAKNVSPPTRKSGKKVAPMKSQAPERATTKKQASRQGARTRARPVSGTNGESNTKPSRPLRKIQITEGILDARGGVGSNANGKQSSAAGWKPSWPPGLSEAEIRKRIGPTQKYGDPT